MRPRPRFKVVVKRRLANIFTGESIFDQFWKRSAHEAPMRPKMAPLAPTEGTNGKNRHDVIDPRKPETKYKGPILCGPNVCSSGTPQVNIASVFAPRWIKLYVYSYGQQEP